MKPSSSPRSDAQPLPDVRRRPHRYPFLGARVLAPALESEQPRLFPAIVVAVRADYRADLCVLYAGPSIAAQLAFIGAAEFDDAEDMRPGTWRWPPHGE